MRFSLGLAHSARIGRGIGMKKAIAGVFLLAVMGCADLRVPIAQADGHLKASKAVVRAATDIPEVAREKLMFHLSRGSAWTGAALEIKGAPEQPSYIPYGPADASTCKQEDDALRAWEAEAKADEALKAAAFGWLGLAGGGGGGLTMATIIALLLKKRKKCLTGKQKPGKKI